MQKAHFCILVLGVRSLRCSRKGGLGRQAQPCPACMPLSRKLLWVVGLVLALIEALKRKGHDSGQTGRKAELELRKLEHEESIAQLTKWKTAYEVGQLQREDRDSSLATDKAEQEIAKLKREERDSRLTAQKIQQEIRKLQDENARSGRVLTFTFVSGFAPMVVALATFIVGIVAFYNSYVTFMKAKSDIEVQETKQFIGLIQTAANQKRGISERIGAIWVLDGYWGDGNNENTPKILANTLPTILMNETDTTVMDACARVIGRAYQGVKDGERRKRITEFLYGDVKSREIGTLLKDWPLLFSSNIEQNSSRRVYLEQAIAGTGHLKEGNLRGVDFHDIHLEKADLSGADLVNADLSHADLAKADLSRANLTKANFRQADLRGTNLSGAIVDDANVEGAVVLNIHDFELSVAHRYMGTVRELPEGAPR